MIQSPNIAFRSRTPTSITVSHEEPLSFTPPSTAWARTIVSAVGSKGDSAQVEVTVPGLVEVVIDGLAGEQTYTVTAVAVSDADELSLPTLAIKKYLSFNPDTDTLGGLYARQLPAVDEAPVLSHEAVARFIDALGFELQSGVKAAAGDTVFIDNLPVEAYKQEAADLADPNQVLLCCRNEPVASLDGSSYNHKVDAVVSVSIYAGKRDHAGVDAARLYRFFQQRRDVQFQVCGFTAHSVRPTGEPVFVGVEDNGLAVYQFRLLIKAARTDLQD